MQKHLRQNRHELSTSDAEVVHLITSAVVSLILIAILRATGYDNGYAVDRHSCTYSCFDRRFKGLHFRTERQYRYVHHVVANRGWLKKHSCSHVYFNITSNTALICIWSAVHLALLHAFVQRALACLYHAYLDRDQPSGLRWSVLTCAIFNFYGIVRTLSCIENPARLTFLHKRYMGGGWFLTT